MKVVIFMKVVTFEGTRKRREMKVVIYFKEVTLEVRKKLKYEPRNDFYKTWDLKEDKTFKTWIINKLNYFESMYNVY